jgi:hypothetical protein
MCGGSATPSNPCFQNSPDSINTLMGSLAYAACGPSPSGICPTPTGPFTGNGYYSWYGKPCPISHRDCAQGGNITNAVYSYGVMSVTGVTPAVGNKLLTQSSPLTPFRVSGPSVPDSNANFRSATGLWGDYVFQCLQNCSSVPNPGSPSKWIVTYPGDTSGNYIFSETITLHLPPAIVSWGTMHDILGSRQNPKFRGEDDAEVVCDRIAKFAPSPGDLVAEEGEYCVGEFPTCRIGFVVREMLVHQRP